MTPEQKAFFEYGKAVETLETRIERIRNNARIRLKMEYHELPLQFRGGLWDDFMLYNVIGDVRRKRAACRAWVHPMRRRCSNCKHGSKSRYEMPCRECFRSAYALQSEMVGDNWEPKKEEKNETDA